MMEIELRAKINNIDKVISQLRTLGATYEGKKHIIDYYFGDLSLYEKVKHSFWIRIREEEDRVLLTYKGPTCDDGVYEEYEQHIQSAQVGCRMFTKMGLDNPIVTRKTRSSYKLDEVNIEIDDIEGLGVFIELEVIGTYTNKESLHNLLDQIEIPKEDRFEIGFITMMLRETNSPFSKWIIN